jgi:hypothetical protein
MAFSRINYIGTGAQSQFAINFPLGFIKRSDVTCYVQGEVDGAGDQVYRELTWVSDGLVTVEGTAPDLGAVVVFERTVSKDELVHDYADGSAIIEEHLDQSNKQSIMLAHEVLDGRFGVIQNNIDMGQFSIKNVADPVDAQDAVNLQHFNANNAYENKVAAQEAQAAAEYASGAAELAQLATETALASAETEANAASTSAALAQEWATKITGPVSGSLYSAKQYAMNAQASAEYLDNFRVANIAALRATSPTVQTVHVLGYYAFGDGGGGMFNWDAGNTDADDAGSIIAATGVSTGRWVRDISTGVNPVMWGAVAGSFIQPPTENSASAFQAMLNTVLSADTPAVIMGQGKAFCVHSTLTIPKGKGFTMRDIRITAGGAAEPDDYVFTTTGMDGGSFGNYNTVISDTIIDCGNLRRGICIQGTQFTTMNSVLVRKAIHGIDVPDSDNSDLILNGCVFSSAPETGGATPGYGRYAAELHGHDTRIIGTQFVGDDLPSGAPEWLGSQAVSTGTYRRPSAPVTAGTMLYCATTGGTTGSSQPTWPTTVGATVTDGTVVWTCKGAIARSIYCGTPGVKFSGGYAFNGLAMFEATNQYITGVEFGPNCLMLNSQVGVRVIGNYFADEYGPTASTHNWLLSMPHIVEGNSLLDLIGSGCWGLYYDTSRGGNHSAYQPSGSVHNNFSNTVKGNWATRGTVVSPDIDGPQSSYMFNISTKVAPFASSFTYLSATNQSLPGYGYVPFIGVIPPDATPSAVYVGWVANATKQRVHLCFNVSTGNTLG